MCNANNNDDCQAAKLHASPLSSSFEFALLLSIAITSSLFTFYIRALCAWLTRKREKSRQTKTFPYTTHCVFLQKQQYCTSIVPSAKLLWQKRKYSCIVFHMCIYIWLFQRQFLEEQQRRQEEEEEEKRSRTTATASRLFIAYKDGSQRDQTSAVLFWAWFLYTMLLLHSSHHSKTTKNADTLTLTLTHKCIRISTMTRNMHV